MRALNMYAKSPARVWACRDFRWRVFLAWVKAAVFSFDDSGAVTTAGVCFHLAGRFPESRVRFIGAQLGGIGIAVVEFTCALDVVDDIEWSDCPSRRSGRAEKGGAGIGGGCIHGANLGSIASLCKHYFRFSFQLVTTRDYSTRQALTPPLSFFVAVFQR